MTMTTSGELVSNPDEFSRQGSLDNWNVGDGRLTEARAAIVAARNAAHEVANTLVCAESWVKEVEASGGVGHIITARAHVEIAQGHALRAVGLCAEAAQSLRTAGADEAARCHALLDGLGMPFEDHGEERRLTLFERVEALAAEFRDLQDDDAPGKEPPVRGGPWMP